MKSTYYPFLYLVALSILPGLAAAQTGDTLSAQDQLNTLMGRLYTVEDFSQRFGNALDNNPDFQERADDPDFLEELLAIAQVSALNDYASTIERTLTEKLTTAEIDSLLEVLQSPYGDVILKAFVLDNTHVEQGMGIYINKAITEASTRLHRRDSLRFLQEFRLDLAPLLDGQYQDTTTNGGIITTIRKGGRQTKTVGDLTADFQVEWLSNSTYRLIKLDSKLAGAAGDTLLVNIYAVEGPVYRYVVKYPDGTYRRSQLTKQEGFTYSEEILQFQYELNQQYRSPEKSPLKGGELTTFRKFGGHPYFPIDPKYRIEANLEVFDNPETIKIETSSARPADYNIYGKVSFTLDGGPVELFIYQSQRSMRIPGYEDYLILPFSDLTNGEETYGGGKYIDLRIPKEKMDTITIDFNRSYQPYCAYTSGYTCPIPPPENFLDLRIEAGVQHLDLGGY